jgi:hypothetical protein
MLKIGVCGYLQLLSKKRRRTRCLVAKTTHGLATTSLKASDIGQIRGGKNEEEELTVHEVLLAEPVREQGLAQGAT